MREMYVRLFSNADRSMRRDQTVPFQSCRRKVSFSRDLCVKGQALSFGDRRATKTLL
jgi:hypothetical protein